MNSQTLSYNHKQICQRKLPETVKDIEDIVI